MQFPLVSRLKTYINRHLINVYTFLNSEFRYENVESSIKHVDNSSRTDNWSITLSKISNEDAKEQVRRLFLSQLGRFLLAISTNEN